MTELRDDRLRLIFTCCHPALAPEAQVALTLRTLGGLTTPEIARAFLVSEATMAQRLVRVKRKIREAGIPYRVPPEHALPERLEAVLAVLYLIFNEGYSATSGDALIRRELCAEAIRLARLLCELDAGRTGGAGAAGADASPGRASRGTNELHRRADRARRAGPDALGRQRDRGRVRPRRARAEDAQRRAIPAPGRDRGAALPGASEPEETDWPQIAALYGELIRVQPTAVVALNHAVAVAMATSPDGGAAPPR